MSRGDAAPAAPRPLKRVQRLAIRVGPWILRALALTWRVRPHNDRVWREMAARKQPHLFTLWHGHLLPLVWVHRDQDVAVLISEHGDGEVIARIAEQLGFATIRGSTTRGAARALLTMARTLEDGQCVAITPDGPRGPVHTFAPGTTVVAQRANVPIVAVGVHASRAWRLRSWDSFLIPKPFATVTVAYSEATTVNAHDARGAADEVARFEALQHAAVEAATRGATERRT